MIAAGIPNVLLIITAVISLTIGSAFAVTEDECLEKLKQSFPETVQGSALQCIKYAIVNFSINNADKGILAKYIKHLSEHVRQGETQTPGKFCSNTERVIQNLSNDNVDDDDDDDDYDDDDDDVVVDDDDDDVVVDDDEDDDDDFNYESSDDDKNKTSLGFLENENNEKNVCMIHLTYFKQFKSMENIMKAAVKYKIIDSKQPNEFRIAYYQHISDKCAHDNKAMKPKSYCRKKYGNTEDTVNCLGRLCIK